jgi:hypothetical protein
MEKIVDIDVMGPPKDKLLGKKIYIETISLEAAPGQLAEVTYVDWTKDGSFVQLEEVEILLLKALHALMNMQIQNTLLGQREFPTTRPPFVPERR